METGQGPNWGCSAKGKKSYTQSVGLLGKGVRLSQGRYLHTEQHKQRINSQTSMPQVGLEPRIPVFERAKTVQALGRAACHCDRL
jgi:hypothetical protein